MFENPCPFFFVQELYILHWPFSMGAGVLEHLPLLLSQIIQTSGFYIPLPHP